MRKVLRDMKRNRIGERALALFMAVNMAFTMTPLNVAAGEAGDAYAAAQEVQQATDVAAEQGTGDKVDIAAPAIPERVADPAEISPDLKKFITDALVEGEDVTITGDKWETVKPEETYNMELVFKEKQELQFVGDATVMTYTLPAGVTAVGGGGLIDITVNIGGVEYVVKDNQFTVSPDGKTLSLQLNTADENLIKLNQTSNAEFKLRFQAQFDLANGKNEVDFGNGVKKEVYSDNSHNAKVEKSGWYDANSGKMHYTIKVTSTGTSENISITDQINGTALTLDTDSITTNPADAGLTVGSTSATGFTATLPKVTNNQTVEIYYTASIDASKIGADGKITSQQNAVAITCDEDSDTSDNSDTNESDALTVTSIQYKSANVVNGTDGYAKIDASGNATIEWTIKVNDERQIALNGKPIQDTIQNGQEYSGTGITVKKTYKNGTTETVNVPWADLAKTETGWTYTPADTEPCSYEITYTTVRNMEGVTDNLTVNNTVSYPYGSKNASGTIGINPDNKFTVGKSVVDVTTDKIDWEIEVNVPAAGYSSLVVTDTYPEQNSVPSVEGLLNGATSVSVTGLTGTESYTLDSSDTKFFKLTFYKDAGKTETGLSATAAARKLKIKVTTKVDPAWLTFAESNDWALGHTNTVNVTAGSESKNASATAYPKNTTVKKTGSKQDASVTDAQGNVYPVYKYEVTVSPVNAEPLVIKDTLPTGMAFYKSAINGETVPETAVYGGGQWYQGEYSDSTNINMASDGTITITNLPKDGDALYGYYKLVYYTIPKDATALKTLHQQATDAGGTLTLTNTAEFNSVSASSNVTYTVDDASVLRKELVNRDEVMATSPVVRNAQYKIVVNPMGLTLNDGNNLTLTDTFSESLSMDYFSIDFDPSSAVVSYDVKGYQLTAVLKDATPVTITYTCRINGKGEVNFNNTVEMSGFTSTSTEKKNYSSGSSGEGSASIPSITILKQEKGEMGIKLQGAVFLLYKVLTKDADGKILTYEPVKDKTGTQVSVTTDAEGKAVIKGEMDKDGWTLYEDQTYFVLEKTAPVGYLKDDTKYQFTIASSGVRDYTHYIYENNGQLRINNRKAALSVTKTLAGNPPADLDLSKITLYVVDGDNKGPHRTLEEIKNYAAMTEAQLKAALGVTELNEVFQYDEATKSFTWTLIDLSALSEDEVTVYEKIQGTDSTYTVTKTYRVGSTGGYDPCPDAGVAVDISKGGQTFELINTYTQDNVGKLEIRKTVTGKLAWDDVKGYLSFTVKADSSNASVMADQTILGTDAGWVKVGSVYVYTIDDVPLGKYTITETNASGLTGYVRSTTVDGVQTTKDGKTVGDKKDAAELTIAAKDEVKTAVFVNDYAELGSLVIEKTVTGAKEWDDICADLYFEVTGPNSYEKTIYGDEDTEAGWKLVGGVYRYTLTGLAAGDYTVTEYDADVTGYTRVTTVDGIADDEATVAVSNNTVTTVEVTNDYTQETGNLEIVKTIVGSGIDASQIYDDATRIHKIEFTIYDGDGKGVCKYTLDQAEFVQTGNTFKLTLTDLPVGMYTVKETRYDVDEGVTPRKYSVVSVVYTLESTVVAGAMDNGADVTVEKGETTTLKVVNTYSSPTGSLVLEKYVEGDGITGLDELIEVKGDAVMFEIYRSTDGTNYDLYRKVTKADLTEETGVGGKKVWRFNANYLPMGTYYVKEVLKNVTGYVWKSTDFDVSDEDATYDASKKNTTDKQTGTFVFDGADGKKNKATVTYTNTYEKLGGLKVKKTVAGGKNWDAVKSQIKFEIYDDTNTLVTTVLGTALSADGTGYSKTVTGLTVGKTYTVKEVCDGEDTNYTRETKVKVGTGAEQAQAQANATISGTEDVVVAFTNTYTAKEAKLVLKKTVAGGKNFDAVKSQISFEIYDGETKIDTIAGTALTLSGGVYTKTIEHLTAGKTYTVKEVFSGEDGNYTRVTKVKAGDSEEITAVQAEVTTSSSTDVEVAFTNTYAVKGAQLILKKTVAGGKNWDAVKGQFKFEIYDGTELKVTVAGADLEKDGDVYTKTVTGLTAGKTYTVKEIFDGEDANYTRVTKVKVDDSAEQTDVETTFVASGTEDVVVAFTNTYTAKEAKLVLKKTVAGGKNFDAVKSQISFEIYDGETKIDTIAGTALTLSGGVYTKTIEHLTAGKTYTVKEVFSGEDGNYTRVTKVKAGDSAETITVQAEVTTSSSTDVEVAFTNTYTAKGAKLILKKTVAGGKNWDAVKGQFKFEVYDGTELKATVAGADLEKDGDVYTKTVTGLTAGKTYTVKEIFDGEDANYTRVTKVQVNSDTEQTAAQAGVTLDADTDMTVSFTNTYTVKEAKLVLKKTVAGGKNWDAVKSQITFKVYDGETEVASVAGTELTLSGGVYAKTITGLESGKTYTVKEILAGEDVNYTRETKVKVDDGAEQTAEQITVTASYVADAVVAFTNTYSVKEAKLILKKTVAGGKNWDAVKGQFKFEIYDGTELKATVAGADLEKNGDVYTKTVTGLESGKTYTVKEIFAGEDANYTRVTKVQAGNEAATEAEQTTVTVSGSADVTVAFTNTYTVKEAKLILKKTVAGGKNWDAVKSQITFEIYDGATKVATVAGTELTLADGAYTKTVTGLESGKTYTVKEICTGEDINYTRVTKVKVNDGAEQTAEETTVTVAFDADAVIAFTNTYTVKQVNLILKKTVAGGKNWDAVKSQIKFEIYDGDTLFATIAGTELTLDNGVYTKTVTGLTAGKTYTVKEICTGEDTKYTRETKVQAGNNAAQTAEQTSVTTAGDADATVSFTNTYTRKTGSLVITKTIKGDASKSKVEKVVKFKVTNNDDGTSVTYTLQDDFTYDASTKKYTLTLDGTPTGGYTVEETKYSVDGYSVKVTYTVNSGSKKSGKKITVDITNNEVTKVDFTDQYSKASNDEGGSSDNKTTDEKKSSSGGSGSGSGSGSSSSGRRAPKTGDDAPLLLWGAMLLLGSLGMTGSVVSLRRRRRRY